MAQGRSRRPVLRFRFDRVLPLQHPFTASVQSSARLVSPDHAGCRLDRRQMVAETLACTNENVGAPLEVPLRHGSTSERSSHGSAARPGRRACARRPRRRPAGRSLGGRGGHRPDADHGRAVRPPGPPAARYAATVLADVKVMASARRGGRQPGRGARRPAPCGRRRPPPPSSPWRPGRRPPPGRAPAAWATSDPAGPVGKRLDETLADEARRYEVDGEARAARRPSAVPGPTTASRDAARQAAWPAPPRPGARPRWAR